MSVERTGRGCGVGSTTMLPWFTAAAPFCLTTILLCTAEERDNAAVERGTPIRHNIMTTDK